MQVVQGIFLLLELENDKKVVTLQPQTKTMERKSAILAIADPNTLSAIGLEKILTELIPSVDIKTFETFEELQAADNGQFAHYFTASRIYFEHTAFFRNNARQTIVLVNGDMQIQGVPTLNVCQSE